MPENKYVHTDTEYEQAAILFREYAAGLDIDLTFQNFEKELTALSKIYGIPSGGILLCKHASAYIGCIAIRRIDADIAELKRMYVKPAWRTQGIAGALLQDALTLAKRCRYKKIRLDTLTSMIPAIHLYKRNGFYEIPAYYLNPEKNVVYFEKIL